MNSELSREQIIEMLPVYALGALEPDEMLAVGDYLEQHRDLLPQMYLAKEAVAQFAHAAPHTPLPANAKARLMHRVEADLANAAPTAEVAYAPAAGPAGESWLAKLRDWFSPINGWTVVAGAAAAALLIVLLSVGQTQSRLDQLTAEVAELRTSVSQLESTNNELQQQLQNDQARLAFIASTAPQRTLQVPATGNSSAAEANGVLYVGNNSEGLLLLRGLEPLAEDQTYQLWVASNGDTTPTSVGLIDLQPDSDDWFSVTLPLNSEEVNVVGLSIEPAGGSPGPGPSGPVVLHTP